ncbi:MAG: FIST N-terminal domain-containing protein [Balneolaceae bacterium]
MKVDHFILQGNQFTYSKKEITRIEPISFILTFTTRTILENPNSLDEIRKIYPGVPIVSCSTSGEIYEAEVLDNSITGVAIQLEKTSFEIEKVNVKDFSNSHEAGVKLANKLSSKNLKHLFILSDGWIVSGPELIEGLYSKIDKEVSISGGMAGDGANFSKTVVGLDTDIKSGNICAIALYGDHIQIGFGSHGGWDEIGSEMEITRANGRVVYELDHKPALDLYKSHLGNDVLGLPGTALLYPVSISYGKQSEVFVRTVHNIDEKSKSIILGAEINEGETLSFMRAEFDDPFEGVVNASLSALENVSEPQLAIIISCIGRKLLFGQSIQTEIDIIKEGLGNSPTLIGFYSYGEICPTKKTFAQLNHQMITITTLSES